jgi:hypothetical protein
MRWRAADVVQPLLLWFHQGMMQQHPPPVVDGAGVGGGGEEQDDGGLLHPPHPEDDPLPQYFQIFFRVFGHYLKVGLLIKMNRWKLQIKPFSKLSIPSLDANR